jgi:hypothetical protein
MKDGGKAAAEEEDRKEGGDEGGSACRSHDKTDGGAEDGRRTSDQERNGAGDENGRVPPRTAYVRGDADHQQGGQDIVCRCARDSATEGPALGDRRRVPRNEKIDDRGGGDNYPAPRRQRQREGVATGDASDRGAGPGRGPE